MNVEVNFLTVLIAAVISMIIGFLWYSPFLFAKPWMKLMGYTSESMKSAQKGMAKMYLISFIVTILTAYVLYHVIVMSMNFFHYDSLSTGITSAIWMWLGFIMPVQITSVIFGKESWKLFFINTGYQLAAVLGMGVTIGLMM
jgi:hypothetical protein